MIASMTLPCFSADDIAAANQALEGKSPQAVLRRAIIGYDAWISAIRRDQTAYRAAAGVVQWDAKFSLVKINPLLSWTKKEVWAFILKHDVPYNPLHDRNYPSIGCWPCTRPIT